MTMTDTPAPQGQYDGLIAALYALRNQDDRKSVKAVMEEAAAAITDLQQQVREARGELSKALEPFSDVDAMALANINGHCDAAKSESYKAGRLDALEEAAKKASQRIGGLTRNCDYLSPMDPETGAFECSKRGDCLCQERDEEAEEIATAILALKDKQP